MMIWSTALLVSMVAAGAQDPTVIEVDAARVLHRVSPLLLGACLEDVNHEIYGGLYSQMIYGESFQEPPRPSPLKGFAAFGGGWSARDGVLDAAPGDGPKLIADGPAFGDGEVGVEILFPGFQGGNAGLIVRVDRPGTGADAFHGYEVSLETSGHLVLGRHRANWEPLRRVACPVPVEKWIALAVRLKGATLEVLVDGQVRLTFEDAEHPLLTGGVGLRDWQRPVRYRNLTVTSNQSTRKLAFEHKDDESPGRGLSGMWGPVRSGSARGDFEVETRDPFVGDRGQRLTFREGQGAVGIENRGLNRWGLNLVAGKPYHGSLWTRSEAPTQVKLAMEPADGSRRFAETSLSLPGGGGWSKSDFTITPDGSDPAGRFAIILDEPGSIVLGHVFLEPGDWGKFKGLPVRKDVAEALVDQGLTVLRYGGSAVNHPQYRWKEMIGPRDRRPAHGGMWSPYSSNGWGIFDFLNFCQAAGFVAIPAVNMGETPQDMADFVEYVNGRNDSPWVNKRVADGHPAPYRLTHLELGNEEAVNEDYWLKFRPIAEAIWAKDPAMILVVGDFAYGKVIEDPYKFEGGASSNSLAAHRKILELARGRNREVWFDIHVTTNQPPEPRGLLPERSYIDQLGKIAPGAKYKVVFFEYNSGNHAMRRALSNALATNQAERIGDLMPIACAANCLQPDGQNDNGWDQGLLFLNPSKTWLQPPGYLIRMGRRHSRPLLVYSEVRGSGSPPLSVNAKRSEDGKSLVLQVVNETAEPRPTRIDLNGFTPSQPSARVEDLSGPPDGVNTADQPEKFRPRIADWRHEMAGGKARYTFPAYSITFLTLE